MIRCFDSHTVRAIRLASCLMPDEVVLTTIQTPRWHKNLFQTSRCNNITDNSIKGTCCSVIVFNRKDTAWSSIINRHHFFRNVVSIVRVVHDIGIGTIITFIPLMLTCLYSYTIATITLLSRLMPDKVILTTIQTPRWHKNLFQTSRCNNITDNSIKGTCCSVIVFNRKDTAWSSIINRHHFFRNVVSIVRVVHDIGIGTIITFIPLMLTCLYSYTIATITLLSRLMPDKVILTIFKTP